jgi:hypothetical protein
MGMVDLVGQSYQLDEVSLSPQRTINFYPEQYGDEDRFTKSQTALIPTPGASIVRTMSAESTDICRGLYCSSSGSAPDFRPRLYGVWGNTVWRFDANFDMPYQIGTVSDNGEPVGMIDNGFDFCLVDGEQMYKYPLASNDGEGEWVTVELPYVPGSTTEKIKPTHIAFLGQRLIVNNRFGNTWAFSKLGLTEFDVIGGLDFYSAEQSSDPILALRSVNGALWLYGNRSYEIWRTSDNQDDPFCFVGGSASQIGIKAPKSLATVNDMVFWLGASDVGVDAVWMGSGNTAMRVSNMGIETQIVSCSEREQAIGWAYASKGNTFYVLSFPYSSRTFVYDASGKQWHERLARDLQSAAWKVYPYQYGVYANNHIYVGTIDGSALAYLDDHKFTEYNGNQIVRQRISPVYAAELNNIQMRQITIDGLVGYTPLLEGLGFDPKILLEVSKDGGSTYGNVKDKSLGKQGNYRKVVRWNSLGIGRSIVLRFTISDPIPFTIYQARLDFEPCART